MRSRIFFLDSPFGWLCFAVFALFVSLSIHLALSVDIDFYDGHNFLLQARRLSDPDYAFVPFDSRRPRTLVLFISSLNDAYRAFTSEYPPFDAYQLMMVGITSSFILVWIAIISILFGRSVAYVTGIFFMCHQLLIHYSHFLLSDTIAGLMWGLCFLGFLFAVKRIEQGCSTAEKRIHAIGLGGLGALAALTKNHMLMLLPATLIVYYFTRGWFSEFEDRGWPNKKAFRKWLALTFFVFLLAIDLLTRIYGYPGEGIPEHIRHLYVQARDAAGEPNPASLYVKNLGAIFGNGFWILSLVSLILWFLTPFFRKSFDPYPPKWKRLSILSLFCVSVAYLVLTQMIPHREVRYVLPFLPVLLLPIAMAAVSLGRSIGSWLRIPWIALWAIVLIHPVKRSIADVKVYYEDPIYRTKDSNSSELYAYLKTPAPMGRIAKQIRACNFALLPKTNFELKEDPYYRRYDMHPQFIYFVGVPTVSTHCPSMSGSLGERLRQLTTTVDPETFYIITENPPNERALPYLVVLKPIALGLPFEQARGMEETVLLNNKEQIHCISSQSHYDCFAYRKFYGI